MRSSIWVAKCFGDVNWIILLFPQAHIRQKLIKEERLELVKAGREDRGKYKSKTAIKQKKVSVFVSVVTRNGYLQAYIGCVLFDDPIIVWNENTQTGGSSNRQKEHKKNMPLAAVRSKAGKAKRVKKMKNSHSGSQFRGRKAWKWNWEQNFFFIYLFSCIMYREIWSRTSSAFDILKRQRNWYITLNCWSYVPLFLSTSLIEYWSTSTYYHSFLSNIINVLKIMFVNLWVDLNDWTVPLFFKTSNLC